MNLGPFAESANPFEAAQWNRFSREVLFCFVNRKLRAHLLTQIKSNGHDNKKLLPPYI